jgi:hypothetical protein
VKDLKEKMLSFYSAGWFRYDLRTPGIGGREIDELSYAYLRYAPLRDSSLVFEIGRERVVEGVEAGLIDGIAARWEPVPHTGLSLYGGVPVETDLNRKKGDVVFGGRVFQRIERKAEIGFSYVRENNDGARFREELGIDLWLSPLRKVEVVGHSFFNNITHGWMDHEYILRLRPVEALTLLAVFSHTDYTNAFSPTTLSVFSPEFLGQGEALTKMGGRADYRFSRTMSAGIDFFNYAYKVSGDAHYYGVSVAATPDDAKMGASIHRMDGATERLRYTEVRVYGRKDIDLLTVSADLVDLHYDTPFNGLHNAYSILGSAEYQVARALTAGLSAEFRKTPDFSHDTRVLAKLAYALRKR